MHVLQAESVSLRLLRVETDGNPLHGPYIIDRTFLVKICKRDVSRFLIDVDRRDRRRNLLDQGKFFFSVLFICPVDKILQGASPKASRIPGCHLSSYLSFLYTDSAAACQS